MRRALSSRLPMRWGRTVTGKRQRGSRQRPNVSNGPLATIEEVAQCARPMHSRDGQDPSTTNGRVKKGWFWPAVSMKLRRLRCQALGCKMAECFRVKTTSPCYAMPIVTTATRPLVSRCLTASCTYTSSVKPAPASRPCS